MNPGILEDAPTAPAARCPLTVSRHRFYADTAVGNAEAEHCPHKTHDGRGDQREADIGLEHQDRPERRAQHGTIKGSVVKAR